ILENILMKVESDSLQIIATDLEITIRTTAKIQGEKDGSCTVPARKFQNLVNELPSGGTEVEVEAKDERLHISVAETNSHFQLPILPEEEFPSFPEVEKDFSLSLESEKIIHMLKNTQFAAAVDSARSYLCGIYFDITRENLTIVSTDAHRLALHSTKLTEEQYSSARQSLLVPVKAIRELIKILSGEEKIEINAGENMVEFKLNETVLISRLIDEDFPNYRQVIPEDYEHRLEIDCRRLYNAVRRVALMADEKTRRLLITVGTGKLIIKAEDSETGAGQEELSVDYKGEETTIAFNGDYLAAVLDHIEDDRVYFDLISPDSPGTFRPLDDNNYLYIIMPLRLG
ncbi:MAG: DNA polymerase III subunit beta, partial [bacterium]